MMYLKAVAFFQGGINLSTMRSSTPQQPSYSSTGTLPAAGYDDPKPTNTTNYDSYLTKLAARENAVGSGQPMQLFDPTAGAAVVGGVSYNLDSKNYSFSLPVMSLAGRAGLNVGLGLSYNSKLWTKDPATTTMIFNGDRGFPAPGWHTGFGAILIKHTSVGPYTNSTTGKSSIIFIAPDGTRRDMAYNSASGRFETYDSTYLKFDATAQILYSPDGTKMKFGVYSYDTNVHDYLALPIEIKDRNGNFITIAYRDLTTSVGVKKVIDYVTDTAGRRIDFNYENNRLTSISQARGGTTFYFVRLDYQPVTIQTSFLAPYVTATDPSNINGTVVYFPSRVTYPTGVNFRFSYTNYGQIKQIEKAVPGITGQGLDRVIAKTTFNVVECLDPNAPPNSPNYCLPQADVPYFNVRTEWAENWQGGQTQYYQYLFNYGSPYVITDPTGRQFKLQNLNETMYTEIWAQNAGNHTKKDTVIFIHDNLSYYSNLRPQETRATAQTGTSYVTKTTQVSYTQLNGMWVPNQQDEFAAGVQYRRTTTTYTSYPSQNILALPLEVSVYSGAGTTLLTKATNAYDQTSSFTDSNGQTADYFIDATPDGAIQHDNMNYGGNFTARGNLTSVTQHSVVNGSVNGSRTLKRISYDTNGNVRAETDPAGNRKQIVYTDNYLDKPGGVGNTCVYPHTTADPTGFRSGAQWLYYTGQSKKTFNLLSGSSTEEQIVTTTYDFADRPSQTTRPDGGWVKTDYWDNWLAVASSQQVDAGKVRFKFEQMDGAGRAYKKASDHPDGASGKFAGQISVFDKVGQVQDSSNVLAIDGSWIPSGEDAGKSFLWTHLTRDELARLKLVTLPDNNSRELDYEGCGCAGSNATRLTDELGHATVTKNDARGRLIEAIEENPNNLFVPYSKAEYVYDELDRLLTINHSGEPLIYNGSRPVQTRTFAYDGYGRMTSETTPEGGTVTYTYTANDQVWQVTNQRPVTTIHTYNSRGLLTNVSYSDSTPAVTYSYDAYGARTTVTDGEGATNYSYNAYRQLQSETRTFTGLTNNTYTLNYTYNQGDQVKSANYLAVINVQPGAPFTAGPFFGLGMNSRTISGTVTNGSGQPVSGVTVTLSGGQSGTTTTNSSGQYSFAGLPNGLDYTVTPSLSGYVFDPSSRTYLGLKQNITDANFTAALAQTITFDKTINYDYNTVGALSAIGTNLIGGNTANNVLNTITFRASGALRQLNYGNGRRLTMGYDDNRNQPTSMVVDRTNNSADKVVDYAYQYYDANGKNNNRIRQITDNIDTAYSTTYTYDNYNRLTNATANAFSRNYQHDPFGNITNFSGLTLNYQTNTSGAPTTNRIDTDSQNFGYTYDAAGNMTVGAGQQLSYDGANRLKTASTGTSSYGYDGDGKRVKKTENGATTYYVYSSKLGQSVMEVNSSSVQRAYVYSGGKVVAMQATDGQFYWLHTNHLGNSRAMTDGSGNLTYKGQFDPYGATLTEWSGSGNTNLNSKKFTGYERDSATGLDYAQARMYNSSRGRFMTPDPIGLRGANYKIPQSLNRYNYVQNDPVNATDSTGNFLSYCEWKFWDFFSGDMASWMGFLEATNDRCSAFNWKNVANKLAGDVGGGGGDSQVKTIHYMAPFDNPRSVLDGYLNRNPGCKNFLNSVKGAMESRSIDQVWDTIDHIRLGDPGPGAGAIVEINEEGGFDITIQGFYVSGVQIGGVTIYHPPIPSLGIPGGSPKEVEHKYIKTLLHEFMHIHDIRHIKGHAEIVITATPLLNDAEIAKVGRILQGGPSDAAFSFALDAIIDSRCPNN
ncbi:MAG: RHS repeat-associated core domain-containing protein [Acidobacteriota bacterium]|nr:RHS repeat-associated core domain-containing protein [Acidobacteriota bacterium]